MILRILGLAIAWVALWGDISPANVLWGVVFACALTWFAPMQRSNTSLQFFGAVQLTLYMMKNLVTSSFAVLRTVIRPTPERVSDAIVKVQLRTQSRIVAVVVANSITLTPGTMTLSLDPNTFELRVHVLGHVNENDFVNSIYELEDVVARAFGNVVPS